MSGIPVVDVAAVAAAQPELAQAGRAIVAALETVGFLCIVGHGVPEAIRRRAFEGSRAFHALPLEAKMAIKQNAAHRGYMPFSTSTIVTSTVDRVRRPNQSESFMMMQELAADDPDVLAGRPLQGLNQWPRQLPEFKDAVLDYNAALEQLSRRLVQAIAVGLGLEADWFDAAFQRPTTFLRMLHYPPHPADAPADLFGSAPHTDYGFITLVAQDGVGGLEVRNRDGSWIPAEPSSDAFVVNAADILMRWTGGRLVSTPHRVINRSGTDRYSIAYFHDPSMDAVVTPLPMGSRRFPPVRYGDYLVERLDKNYDYRRPMTQTA
jgi:isopenicillin N synthase-like dioxygenase